MLTTDWLIERLPADAIAMTRFFGSLNMCSLRKVEMLSTPALVRVSANITRPSRTRIPPQYVIDSATPSEPVYHSPHIILRDSRGRECGYRYRGGAAEPADRAGRSGTRRSPPRYSGRERG